MAIYCAKCGTRVGIIGPCPSCKKRKATHLRSGELGVQVFSVRGHETDSMGREMMKVTITLLVLLGGWADPIGFIIDLLRGRW